MDVDRELARLGIDVDPSRPEGHPALRGAPPVSPAVTRQALTLVSEPPVQLDDDGPVLELGVAAQPAARPDGRSLETRLGQPVRPHDVPDEADLEQTLRSDGHHPQGELQVPSVPVTWCCGQCSGELLRVTRRHWTQRAAAPTASRQPVPGASARSSTVRAGVVTASP
ncbi:hypothetical protein G7075_08365 [Phycicoccus sp. HDW14]|uniref:hypothetical protein n=1 Tax=Phycicoccus sp. HDW14 TaxID=2714941 RepID=UPI00140D8293|nr:hypothetical protein [Phycicoccus sp. HDW14]QIM21139.1 hypothetical protein G7075_08365 [Phycicoccus sp. HDW14]